MPDEIEVSEEKELETKAFGATSFAELDAQMEAQEAAHNMMNATEQFSMLAQNIMMSEMVEDKTAALQDLANEFAGRVSDATKEDDGLLDKETFLDKVANVIGDHVKQERPMKTEGGTRYPVSDYAYVPDPEKPSTWKLRMSQGRPGNITASQLGRAAAAFSSGGFRGQRVEIPQSDQAKVKRKLRSEYSKLGVKREDMPDSVKELSFSIWYDKELKQYKWLAVYSNNIIDNEDEIIASESHQNFVKEVSEGSVPLPELWLWHIPEWKWGVATDVAYDDTGFALAVGTVDKNKEAEDIAKWIEAQGDDILVSHGMPRDSVERDSEDKSIIVKHRTREVSPLPAFAAANKFTSFSILKEATHMAIPQQKKDELVEQGLTAETLDKLEERNADTSKETDEAGLKKKEDEQTPAETQPEPVEAQDEAPLTRQEVAEAITETTKPLMESIQALANQVKELTEVQAGQIPQASLTAMVKENLFGKETQVDGRSSLAKQKPTMPKQEDEPDANEGFFPEQLGWLKPGVRQ